MRNQVCQEKIPKHYLRKYYRFRYSSQFYGGIVTADVVGCNLHCLYCWSQKTAWNPQKGSWYGTNQVVKTLVALCKKHNCHRMRLSGGEPTLCKEHLFGVLKQVPDNILFILETNGILLANPAFVETLEDLKKSLYVRISLKAGQTHFMKVTGAPLEMYTAQIQAIKLLLQSTLRFNVAIMKDFFLSDEINKLEKLIIPKQLEIEQLILYPFVREKLKTSGFIY